MKKIIKKNIAVVLSAVLILGAVLPVFSGVVVGAYTAENTVIKNNIDTACDTLIEEWVKLDSDVKGLDKLTPYELATEAVALDLSDFDNTSAFVAARQNLAALLVNCFDPTEIKNAWGKMYRVVSTDFYAPFAITGQHITKDDPELYSDTTFFKTDRTNITVNQGDSTNNYIFGKKSVTFDYDLGINRTAVTGTTEYEIFLSNDPENIADDKLASSFSSHKKLYGIDDLQISFVINEIRTSATGMKMGFKLTAESRGVLRSSFYVNIDEEMVNKVQTVKLSDIVGGLSGSVDDWMEEFSTKNSITRIELQLCDLDNSKNVGVNMTLGSVVAINYNDVPTAEESENWNVSDWLYAAKCVDTQGAYNADAFEEAIRNAEELREISGVEMSNTVTSFNNLTDFNELGENLIFNKKPIIRCYDGVSENKEERICLEYKKLTDGDLNKSVSIEAGDFNNEGAFFEIVYDLGENAVIEKTAVVSAYENALRNYKYRIYMAANESELFTKEALAFSYTNRDASWIQVFDFTNGPDKIARYIAIRVYAPACDMEEFDGFVRFDEIGVYGEVKDYTVSASEFSSNAIAALGKNILNFNTTKAFVRADTGNRQRFTSLFDSQTYPISNLYDADVNTQVAIGGNYRMYYDGDTTSLHIYYDLGKTYAIDKFLYSSMAGTLVETGKYRIHASNDLNKLFNGKSVVVDYDNTVNTSRMQIFSMNNVVNARYVSFEVTLPLADYKGWLARNGIASEGAAIRIGELGVFGGEYVKTNEKENLLTHIPATLSRIDANGNKLAVGQSEYSGDAHLLTNDGDYDTFTTVATEGKTLEYAYNLYQNAIIESIRFISLTDIESIKFYASSSKTAVYDESALVYEYEAKDGKSEKVFSKYFVDTPLTASYVRIVVSSSAESLEIAEIEVNGFNKTKAAYENIVLNRTDFLELYLVDSKNSKSLVHENMDKWLPGWSSASEYQEVANAFDGDLGTIYTYYGGKNNDTSVNMFLNLQAVSSVDNISVYTSVLEDYRPSKMNIYVGNSRDEVFAANATPIKVWSEKILDDNQVYVPEDDEEQEGEDIFDGDGDDDDIVVDFESGKAETEDIIIPSKEKGPNEMGLYSVNFMPMEISCIRIEIVEANPTYFAHKNKVGGIITEVQVNGFSAANSAVNNVVESTKDLVMRALDPVNAMDKSNVAYTNSITDGIEGEPVYTVNSVGENIAFNYCDAGGGYVEYMQTNDLASSVTLADIDDIYFSYKVKKAHRSGSIAARVYIYDGSKWAHDFATKNGTATVIYVDSQNSEWVHTSMSKQFGENWRDWLSDALGKPEDEITINRIRFGWNNMGGAADMWFTGMYYTFKEGANPYYNTMIESFGNNGRPIDLRMSKYYVGTSGRTPTYINSGKANEYVNINSVGGEVGEDNCSSYAGNIRFAATSTGKNATLADIDNIYFSYRMNNVVSGDNVVARIFIYDQNGKMAETFARGGTQTVFYFSTLHTDWTEISIRDVVGNDWKEKLIDSFNSDTGSLRTAEEIKISEIRFGFNYTGEADMSFGNIFYQYKNNNTSTMSHAGAVAVLNKARELIDTSTVAKKTAKEFKNNVQFLADYLDMSMSEPKYMAGDYGNTEAGMKELALMAQYFDKTLGADDFMDPYCADINGDGVLSEADLIKLRKKLLGISN